MGSQCCADFAKVGKRVKAARKQRGLTQENASEAADISAQYFSLIENGRQASLNIYLRISEALGLTLNDLFYEPCDKPTQPYNYDDLVASCTATERAIADETLAWLGAAFKRLRGNS